MEDIQIINKQTADTPLITFDRINHVLSIVGASYPVCAHEFYLNMMDKFKNIDESQNIKLTCKFDLTILSSASYKVFFEILHKLEKLYKNNSDIKVIWYYDKYDEDLYNDGLDFKETFSFPFEFVKINRRR